MEISDEQLVDLVERMTEDRFLDFIDGFVEENAQYFEPDAAGGEGHKLFHTEIHQKYQRLFESRVEAWLQQHGYGVEAFMAAVHWDDSGLAGDIAEQLLAVSSFESFSAMMIANKHNQVLEAAPPRPTGDEN
mmetsp:Transcript_79311/g.208295  ORF Transcript_79311/g.208295 Transcript_79311/m.208295 type:complete len:132 (-) Transcript_79311:8-403(-)